jgi:hypothetical protein
LKHCFINFSHNITFQLTRSSGLLFTLSCCAYWYPTNTKCSLGTNISTILRQGIFLRDDNQFSSKLSKLFVRKKLFLEKIQNLKMLQRNKKNLQHIMFLTVLEMTKEEIFRRLRNKLSKKVFVFCLGWHPINPAT